jgi:hypothetical protein
MSDARTEALNNWNKELLIACAKAHDALDALLTPGASFSATSAQLREARDACVTAIGCSPDPIAAATTMMEKR